MKRYNSYSAQKYAALAQLYRWSLVYEIPQTDKRLQNALQMITDDFILNNVDGIWKGRERYIERLHLIKKWDNAHHVHKARFKKEGGDMWLETDSLWQIVMPDGAKENYQVNFVIRLRKYDNDLPKIREVVVNSTYMGQGEGPGFKRSYMNNRCMSFVYYWLYHLERFKNDAIRLRHLFAGEYWVESHGEKTFRNMDQIAGWMQENYDKHGQPRFNPKTFSAEKYGEDSFRVVAEIGDKANGSASHFEIILDDNADEAFAKIKRMKLFEPAA